MVAAIVYSVAPTVGLQAGPRDGPVPIARGGWKASPVTAKRSFSQVSIFTPTLVTWYHSDFDQLRMAEVVDTIALDKTRSFNKFDKDAVTGSRVHGGLGGVDQLASCS